MKKIILPLLMLNYTYSLTINLPTVSRENPQLQFINCKSWDLCTLDESFIAMICHAFAPINAVETGTFKGDTIARFAKYVPFKYTIELSIDLFHEVQKRFASDKTIFTYQGDSAQVLPKIISQLKGKTLFFLDANFNGNGTAKGSSNTPILAELETIKNAGLTNSIIVIDDIRMFYNPLTASVTRNTIMEGYPTLQEIVAKIQEINPDYTFAIIADDLIAFPASENVSVSEVVQATTISRLYDGKNFSTEQVTMAENTIAQAQGEERATIIRLADYCTENWGKQAGLARHFPFWYGLILNQEGNKARATSYFKEAHERGLNHAYYISSESPALLQQRSLMCYPTMSFTQVK